jgi:hypothetical protein
MLEIRKEAVGHQERDMLADRNRLIELKGSVVDVARFFSLEQLIRVVR